MDNQASSYLPKKVPFYLKRLLNEYEASQETTLLKILQHSKIYVMENATSYSDYGNTEYGHNIKFFIQEGTLRSIKLKEQDKYTSKLKEDLNICSRGIEGEFFNAVLFEMADEEDPEYQEAFGLSKKIVVDPDSISIWEKGFIRLFISHRDKNKKIARDLAEQFMKYKVSGFVAHDTIQPMTTWQNEILKGLETMEVMLALITDDFHESSWTNQELGFALGRNIPIITLKLENKAPDGFIGNVQAIPIRNCYVNGVLDVEDIYDVMIERLGITSHKRSILIDRFTNATSFKDASSLFLKIKQNIKSFEKEEARTIMEAYRNNSQLHNCFELQNDQLLHFLESRVGEKFLKQ